MPASGRRSRRGISPSQSSFPSAKVTLASAQSDWSQPIPSPASPTSKVNASAPARSTFHLAPWSAKAHHLGLERHFVIHLDHENDAPFASRRVLVVIQAEHCREAPARARKVDAHPAESVAVKSTSVLPFSNFQRLGSQPVLDYRIMISVPSGEQASEFQRGVDRSDTDSTSRRCYRLFVATPP